MKKFAHLTTLVAATALLVAPLGVVTSAQAAPPASVTTAKPAKATAHQAKLDMKIIKSLKSRDHTTSIGKVKISPLIEPSATVWTSTQHGVDAVLAWEIRDLRNQGDRIRVCSDDPSRRGDECAVYRLAEVRGGRTGIAIQETRSGWNVFVRPSYEPRSSRECRFEGLRGSLVNWTIDVLDGRRVLASSESSWRLRCVR